MNDPIAVASAWSQLQQAWAWRWFFILAIGAMPQLWCWLMQRDIDARPWCDLRRICALVSLLLTLWSLRLLVDTWQLDAEDPQALSDVACTVSSVPSWRFAPLVCADAKGYWLDVPAEAEVAPGAHLRLTVLPVTGMVARVQPAQH